jgi:hypothetical protein
VKEVVPVRLIEAAAGGVVAAIVVVLIADRIGVGDLVLVGAVAFLVPFLAVLLRPDRPYNVVKRR